MAEALDIIDELKAENERLKKTLIVADRTIVWFERQKEAHLELEAENERLKKEIKVERVAYEGQRNELTDSRRKLERVSTCLENDAFQMAKEWLEGEQ